jgi:hypothetical protein
MKQDATATGFGVKVVNVVAALYLTACDEPQDSKLENAVDILSVMIRFSIQYQFVPLKQSLDAQSHFYNPAV